MQPGAQLADEFRRTALAAVDWVADYLTTVAERPVAARVGPGEVLNRLEASLAEPGKPFDEVLESLTCDLLPGVTHWNHPRFLAYVPQSATAPAMAADIIASALNVNGLLWNTSPAVAELEQAVLGRLGQLLGLPSTWFGQVMESASLATLTALAVARERTRRETGRQRSRVVCSTATHASVHKAGRLLDLAVAELATDREGRMRPDLLMSELAHGDVCAVVATVGSTSRAAIDPVPDIGPLCAQHGAWLHVDGAYTSAAAICPEYAHLLDGIATADSFVINAHKWLGLTAPCSCLYTAHCDELRATFSTAPDYLEKDEDRVNLVDYGPMFSHRFYALKLWFALQTHGEEHMRDTIRRVVGLAAEVGSLIAADPDWDLCSQSFGVVCFRLKASDAANVRLLREVNADGRILISPADAGGQFALRLAVGNAMTRREDILVAWDVLREHAARNDTRTLTVEASG